MLAATFEELTKEDVTALAERAALFPYISNAIDLMERRKRGGGSIFSGGAQALGRTIR